MAERGAQERVVPLSDLVGEFLADGRPNLRALGERGALLLPDLLQSPGLHEHRPRDDAAVGDPERLAHLALGAYRLDVVLNAVEEPAQLAPGLDAHELAELRGDLGEVSHADALLDSRQLARPLGRDFLGLERGAVLRLQIVEILHAAVELDVVLGALLVGGVVSGRGGLQRAKLGLRLAQLDLGFGALKHGSLSSRVP